jgi:hypothetical protein
MIVKIGDIIKINHDGDTVDARIIGGSPFNVTVEILNTGQIVTAPNTEELS